MLENTKYKLTKTDKLTVAYFGGSITEGAGASDYAHCWAGLTTKWLGEKYPNCEIKGIQAAIGGTGSTLGVHRFERDVLSYKPDLVFFEFAVNDSFGRYDELSNNCDAVLRKLWNFNPFADIVMIYTVTSQLSGHMAKGGINESRTAFASTAYYYGGIPQIDVGEVLRIRTIAEGGDWMKYTCDGCHPNDAGYAIYLDVIKDHLGNILDSAKELDAPAKRVLPSPLYVDDSRINAHMEDAFDTAEYEGFEKVEQSLCGRYPHYLEAVEPGASLTYAFTGKRIELYWMLAKDSGDIIYSVDGGEERTMRSWDTYCPGFNRAGNHCLAYNLPYGRHILKLRVADTKAEESQGHAIRIGAYLVS